jgi:hypothetical protein
VGSSTGITGCRAKDVVSREVRRAGSPRRTGGPLARLQRTFSANIHVVWRQRNAIHRVQLQPATPVACMRLDMIVSLICERHRNRTSSCCAMSRYRRHGRHGSIWPTSGALDPRAKGEWSILFFMFDKAPEPYTCFGIEWLTQVSRGSRVYYFSCL